MNSVYGPRAEYYYMRDEWLESRSFLRKQTQAVRVGYTAATESSVHLAHFHVVHVKVRHKLLEQTEPLLDAWLELFKPNVGRRDWIVFVSEMEGQPLISELFSIRVNRIEAEAPPYFVWSSLLALDLSYVTAPTPYSFLHFRNRDCKGVYTENQADLESLFQCCIGAQSPLSTDKSRIHVTWSADDIDRNMRLFCVRFLEKRACTELWTNACGKAGSATLICGLTGDVKVFEVELTPQTSLQLAAAFSTATPEEWRRLLQWLANSYYRIECIADFPRPAPEERLLSIKVQPISHTGWLVNQFSTFRSATPTIYSACATVIAPKSGTAAQREQLIDFCRTEYGVEPVTFSSRTLSNVNGFARMEKLYALFVRCVLCFAPLGFPEMIVRRILEYAYPKFLLMYETDQTRIIVRVNKALADAREACAKEEALEVIEQAAKKQRT